MDKRIFEKVASLSSVISAGNIPSNITFIDSDTNTIAWRATDLYFKSAMQEYYDVLEGRWIRIDNVFGIVDVLGFKDKWTESESVVYTLADEDNKKLNNLFTATSIIGALNQLMESGGAGSKWEWVSGDGGIYAIKPKNDVQNIKASDLAFINDASGYLIKLNLGNTHDPGDNPFWRFPSNNRSIVDSINYLSDSIGKVYRIYDMTKDKIILNTGLRVKPRGTIQFDETDYDPDFWNLVNQLVTVLEFKNWRIGFYDGFNPTNSGNFRIDLDNNPVFEVTKEHQIVADNLMIDSYADYNLKNIVRLFCKDVNNLQYLPAIEYNDRYTKPLGVIQSRHFKLPNGGCGLYYDLSGAKGLISNIANRSVQGFEIWIKKSEGQPSGLEIGFLQSFGSVETIYIGSNSIIIPSAAQCWINGVEDTTFENLNANHFVIIFDSAITCDQFYVLNNLTESSIVYVYGIRLLNSIADDTRLWNNGRPFDERINCIEQYMPKDCGNYGWWGENYLQPYGNGTFYSNNNSDSWRDVYFCDTDATFNLPPNYRLDKLTLLSTGGNSEIKVWLDAFLIAQANLSTNLPTTIEIGKSYSTGALFFEFVSGAGNDLVVKAECSLANGLEKVTTLEHGYIPTDKPLYFGNEFRFYSDASYLYLQKNITSVWTTIQTWIGASSVKDGFKALSTSQSLSANTEVKINTLLTIAYNVGSRWNTSSQRFEVGTAGIYSFIAQAKITLAASGTVAIRIKKNGNIIAEAIDYCYLTTMATIALHCAVEDQASVNDYYEMFVYTATGYTSSIGAITFFCGGLK